MKIIYAFLLVLITGSAFCQNKNKQKAPTQKQMDAALREAQAMMDEAMKDMSDEDRRMMDSMGIKMPDLKNVKVPKASDKQLAAAFEDDNRLVPKKDQARIASIPKQVTAARLTTYIAAIQKKMMVQLDSKTIEAGNKIFTQIKADAQSTQQAGSMATAFWISGQPELSLFLLGRICIDDASQTDNLSNYAAALTMLGGEHLALPILQNLNAKYRRNSTLLNNIGQAWFGLGDLIKAEKYLDSAMAIYPHHPQANLTKAAIEESRGNTTKAIEHVKRSIHDAYSKDKEDKLRQLGYKPAYKDLRIPFEPTADPLGLEKTRRPDYPLSVGQINALLPYWEQFNKSCDDNMSKIGKEMEEATARYTESSSAMASKALATIQSGGLPMISQPLFMLKASLALQEREEFYGQKMKKQTDLYMQLQNDLTAIRKAYRPAPADAPCSAHRDAINAMLKALNERKKRYDDDALTLFRNYSNDFAYWAQYTSLDQNAFQIIQLKFQLFWLQKNRELQPLDMQTYVGAYSDCPEKEDAKPGKLAEFDDVACNYRSSYDFGIVQQEISCSHTTTTYNFGMQSITERELGNKYVGGTIKYRPKIGVGGKAGPLEVEGFIEAEITTELDENKKVIDWKGTVSGGVETSGGIKSGPVKVKGSVRTEVEIELSSRGIEDVNMIGTAELSGGAYGQNVKVGVQDKVSLISGHGSVKTLGTFRNIIVSEW